MKNKILTDYNLKLIVILAIILLTKNKNHKPFSKDILRLPSLKAPTFPSKILTCISPKIEFFVSVYMLSAMIYTIFLMLNPM